jgi:hypothetical protein
MFKKRNALVLRGLLLACFLFSGTLSAQKIDPCWYGCPKDGCPQCDKGGGPIKAQDGDTSKRRATVAAPCVERCKENNLDRINDCNIHFPPDRNRDKHAQCLDKSKALFDKCRATC